MVDVKDGEERSSPQPRHCPVCNGPARKYMPPMLDLKRSRTVQLYRCDPCEKVIWDD